MLMLQKIYIFVGVSFFAVLICGCSAFDNSSEPSESRHFVGITERNEFGDTLSIDQEDWVVVGFSGLSIGAFPNPFIPGAGRLLINLTLPVELNSSLYAVNESGSDSIILSDQVLSAGTHTLLWNGIDSSGNRLADGNYRIFFDAGMIHSFGDVTITLANFPDPPLNSNYVGYAQDFYDSTQYFNWEWQVARDFGPSGLLGGPNRYDGSFDSWQALSFLERFLFLPTFFNYDLRSSSPYQYHYLLAYKHFQFGAGWPSGGHYGVADTTNPEWQLGNYYHDIYVQAFQSGP
jgi:hypothetical protein